MSKYVDSLWTAEKMHDTMMWEMEYVQKYSDSPIIKRIIPTEEIARDYAYCQRICYRYYAGILSREEKSIFTPDIVHEMERRRKVYANRYLDMRDVRFEKSGKVGLKRVTGEIVLEPIYDGIPEVYDCLEEECVKCAIPVVMEGKYGLVNMSNGKTILEYEYDRIFKFFGESIPYFVVEKDSKKGLVWQHGDVAMECIADEIYVNHFCYGFVPYRIGDKWGVADGYKVSKAIFDDITQDWPDEGFIKVKKDGKWGWINKDGDFTRKKCEAVFSYYSFYD